MAATVADAGGLRALISALGSADGQAQCYAAKAIGARQTFPAHIKAVLLQHQASMVALLVRDLHGLQVQVLWHPAEGLQHSSCFNLGRQNSCLLPLKRCVPEHAHYAKWAL